MYLSKNGLTDRIFEALPTSQGNGCQKSAEIIKNGHNIFRACENGH
jgi:hypothetical protein